MDRETKTQKKIARSNYRRKKRMEVFIKKIEGAKQHSSCFGGDVPLCAINKDGSKNYGVTWFDASSRTKWKQFCSYDEFGTCDFPCNGDC